MALKGTIRDFGIADIFQLIGQQAKTGVLILRSDVDEVRVYFKDGAVVRADSATRPGQMLLGSFLVRAEVLTQEQLDHALTEQRRTLKRLGLVLVELGYAKREPIVEFSTLQMTETIYSLFQWKNGTYEFESEKLEESDEGIEPIRAENIVMNGIRMVDEWPAIRARVPSYTLTVERMKQLPPPKKKAETSDEFNLSSLTDEGSMSVNLDDIGAYERMIYGLCEEGRDVQKIIDLARLGEFEACRALANLMSNGYVRLIGVPAAIHHLESDDLPTETPGQRVARYAGIFGRIAVSAMLVLSGAMLLGRISPVQLGLDPGADLSYEPKPIEGHFSETQMRVIKRTLEVYRYETGVYPQTLETLVDYGLLSDRDIRFPYHRTYFYRLKDDGSVVLLPPIN